MLLAFVCVHEHTGRKFLCSNVGDFFSFLLSSAVSLANLVMEGMYFRGLQMLLHPKVPEKQSV